MGNLPEKLNVPPPKKRIFIKSVSEKRDIAESYVEHCLGLHTHTSPVWGLSHHHDEDEDVG